MKIQNIIRILAGLSFLIFFCPFYQTCSDKSMLKKTQGKEITVEKASDKDSITPEKIHTETNVVIDPVTKNSTDIEQKAKDDLNESRERYTLNGYGMGYYILMPDAGEFKLKDLLDVQFYAFFSYIIIMILSTLIFAFSFRGKYKAIKILSFLNILLAIGSMAIFYFEGGLDDPAQIKFGYYLFLMNSIAIIAFCNRTIKRNAI
jgi:hypothetical protein